MAMRFFKKGESGFDKQQLVRVACKAANGTKTAQEIYDSLKSNDLIKEMEEDSAIAFIRNFWRDQLKAVEEAKEGSPLFALKAILKPLKNGQGQGRSKVTASAEEMASFFE